MKGSRPLVKHEVSMVASYLQGRFRARNRALFFLGLKSGFRISELLSIRIGDVLQNGRFVDYITVKRCNMKKKIEGRTIRLNEDAKMAIKAWIKMIKNNGDFDEDHFLFHAQGKPYKPITRTQAWRILTNAYKLAGLTGKLGTHALRKTFANGMYEALDHDLFRMQKALGHRDPKSTVSYLSFKEQEIDDAVMSI
jgi:integrase